MLSADIAAVQGVERPAGVTIGLHVCQGNQSSKWMGEGDYEPVAEELFGRLPVDRLLLEYDDERAGGFAPLRFVPPGTVAVLGLVSSKTGEPEPADSLRARIGEAAEPTLISVTPQQSLWHDEVFGPVLAVTTADGFDDAVRLANDTAYGLAAAVFATSLTFANKFTDQAEAGQVAVNLPAAGWDVHHPFGGFRESGSAFKEQGARDSASTPGSRPPP